MYRCGLANQPTSVARDDGLQLHGAYVAAVNRCAPPGNKPTPEERDRCLPFLEREIAALMELQSIVALGAFAWDGILRALAALGHATPRPKPRFGHGAETVVGPYRLVGLLPPEPAEHVHGQAHPRDARRGAPHSDDLTLRPPGLSGLGRIFERMGRHSRFYATPAEKPDKPVDRATVKRVVGTFRPYRSKVTIVGVLIAITSGLGVVNPLLIVYIFNHGLFGLGSPPVCNGTTCPNMHVVTWVSP